MSFANVHNQCLPRTRWHVETPSELTPEQLAEAQQGQPFPGGRQGKGDRRWRIALYSHDTMGLGHKRRNLLIAQTLSTSTLNADVLMISGMGDASGRETLEGVDCLTLPALYKNANGQYQARRLGLELADIIQLRSHLICTAIQQFQPHVLIVDNVPRGAVRELDPTLEYIASQPHMRCVLGLRDILDTPATVQRDWQRSDNEMAIRRYYDAIWVYGDPAVYDLRNTCNFFPDITAKMRFLGYLNPRARLRSTPPGLRARVASLALPHDNLVLCLVGGGQDGAALATAFAQSTFPTDTIGVLLTGPFMPQEQQRKLAALVAKNPQLRLVDYLEEPTLLLERASRVVAMGGYNTTCEVLALQKPALLVPRVTPRQEQWIRAKRLQEMGLIAMLHPNHLSSETITHWLHQPLSPTSSIPINFSGLDNLLTELQRLLSTTPMSTAQAS